MRVLERGSFEKKYFEELKIDEIRSLKKNIIFIGHS